MRRAKEAAEKQDSPFKGKTGAVGGGLVDLSVSAAQRTRIARPIKLQFPKLTRCPSLESRGKAGDGDEAEESGVENNTSSAVLAVPAAAVGAVDLARIRSVGVGVLVGLVVVGRAGQDALDLAIAALVLGSRLGELLARVRNIARAGNVEGALDVLKRREFNTNELDWLAS
jgi:hypothetical protein